MLWNLVKMKSCLHAYVIHYTQLLDVTMDVIK